MAYNAAGRNSAEARSETSGNRILYLDYLRIAATLAVIILHVAASNWTHAGVDTLAWNVSNVFDSCVRWGVPVFVMISGSLFLNPEKNICIKSIFTKYIFRIIVAFIVWSTFYSITIHLSDFSISGVLTSIITGEYHMWFLFMIVGLYIVTPILRKITASLEITQYFLAVSLVFTFIIPFLLGLPVIEMAQPVYDNVHFHLTLGYSCYFVAGYYLSTRDISSKLQKYIYIAGIAGFIMTIAITAWLSLNSGEPVGKYYDNFSIGVLLESVSVFVFVKQKSSPSKASHAFQSVIHSLAKYSFGAYLIHVFIIRTLTSLGLTTLSLNPLLSVPLISIIVAVISFAISALLNQIPIIKKYIV